MYDTLKIIGKNCQRYRVSIGYTQKDVGDAIGYGGENISSFECGRCNNALILLWYISKGISYDEIMHGRGGINA